MNNEFRGYTRRHLGKSLFSAWISNFSLTTWIILINVFCFIGFIIAGFFVSLTTLNSYFALNPNNLFLNGYVWTLLTSMFLHAGFLHLFVNMFSLYFIGNFLEMLIGKKRFFWFYLLAGLFAGLFFAFLAFFFGNNFIGGKIFGNTSLYAVGASGAIFGIAGIMAVLTPKNKVYLIMGPLLAIVLQAIFEKVIPFAGLLNFIILLINIYIFVCIFALLSSNNQIRSLAIPWAMPLWILPFVAIIPLVIIGFFVDLPIGNSAHLGGLLAGLAYGFYLKYKYKNKVKLIQGYFSQ